VRQYADEKTVKVADHAGRNALHRAVLFERRFIVDELLRSYAKLLVNGIDTVRISVLSLSFYEAAFALSGRPSELCIASNLSVSSVCDSTAKSCTGINLSNDKNLKM